MFFGQFKDFLPNGSMVQLLYAQVKKYCLENFFKRENELIN
jgi:hypothetical protein